MYISATPESVAALMKRDVSAAVTMLNLVRFREIADYSESPELEPDEPISGKHAYSIYTSNTIPLLTAVGGRTIYHGRGGPFLVGPPKAWWDHVTLVEYPSVQAFLDLTQNPEYLSGTGHRTAALADSRVLPMT